VRSDGPFDEKRRQKLSSYCNLDSDDIIENPNVADTIYEIPEILNKQDFSCIIKISFLSIGIFLSVSARKLK
jgi:CTP synthase (UTP-ammonia lyase)